MKFFNQLIILLIIAGALYIARDDVKIVYNRILSYVENDANFAKFRDSISLDFNNIATPSNSVSTPGALTVTDGVAYSALDVKLSIKDVIALTNKNRADNGSLPPLSENSKLDLSAKMKLDDMLRQQYFEHVSPDGVGVSDLGAKAGYEYIIIGENLALGNFKNATSLVNAWMESPGHRANILNSRYAEIGVAVGHGMYEGRDTWLAVQHFGLPRSTCPVIDQALYGVITVTQDDIKRREADLAERKKRIDSGAVYEGKTTNEQIDEYNARVSDYNDRIADLKQKLAEYNAQVRAFNTCLTQNTN